MLKKQSLAEGLEQTLHSTDASKKNAHSRSCEEHALARRTMGESCQARGG